MRVESLMNGVGVFLRSPREHACPCPPGGDPEGRCLVWTRKGALTRRQPHWCPDLGLAASMSVGNKGLFTDHPTWAPVMPPEWIKSGTICFIVVSCLELHCLHPWLSATSFICKAQQSTLHQWSLLPGSDVLGLPLRNTVVVSPVATWQSRKIQNF